MLWLGLWSFPLAGEGAGDSAAVNKPFSPDKETVLLLHFDGDLSDASASACRAAASDDPGFEPGRFGQAVAGGGRGWIKIQEGAENLAFRQGEPFTVEMWLFQEQLQSASIPLAVYHTGAPWGLEITKGMPGFKQYIPGRWGGAMCEAAIEEGKWNHVALTVDQAEMLTSFFINGRLVHRADLQHAISPGAEAVVWIMGMEAFPNLRLQGLLDELRISRCIRYDPTGAAATGKQVFQVESR